MKIADGSEFSYLLEFRHSRQKITQRTMRAKQITIMDQNAF